MSITQDQIAKQLGVSRQSVVRALGGHGKVSESTRRLIIETAREMGSTEHSNQASRIMNARRYGKRVKTGIIAVLMSYEGEALRGLPFFVPILDGIELEASDRIVDVYHCYSVKGRPLPRLILENSVDGLISLGSNPGLIASAVRLTMPIVSIVGRLPLGYNIVPRSAEGMGLAVRHLADLGHKRIAYLGLGLGSMEAEDRFKGFQKALRTCGLTLHKELVDPSLINMEVGGKAMNDILKRSRDFTALVCYNDYIAMQAVRTLEEHGLRVPGDISVVGFDDVTVPSNFKPALTSIAYERQSMGRRAVEWISERTELLINNDSLAENEVPLEDSYPVELVVRDSTRGI